MSVPNPFPSQVSGNTTSGAGRLRGNALSNISIAWKIGLIIIMLSLTTWGVMGIAGFGLQTMRFHVDNLYNFMLVPILSISNANTLITDDEFQFQKLIAEDTTPVQHVESLDTIRKNDISISDVISRYETEWVTTISPEFTEILRNAGQLDLQTQEVATLKKLQVSFNEYATIRQSFVDNAQKGQISPTLARSVIAKLQIVRENMLALIDINNNFAYISNQAATTAYNQTIVNTSWVLLVTLLLSLVLSFLILNSITSRLSILTRSAHALQEGDFNQKVAVFGRDEVGQLGSVFSRMAAQLKELFDSQEQRVADRTHDLELASEVGRAMTEKVENLSELLSQAAELIRSRFDLYYTQIYMADSSGRNLNLRAGTGHVGYELLRRRHHLPIASGSLNGRAAAEHTALIVADTLKSGTFLPNPLLPLTRSEMAVPLIANGKVLGVLDMQSERPGAFSEANLPAFQVLAGQLAIAIQNAALFQQAEESRLEVEAQANRLTATGWQEFLNAVDRSESIGYVYSQNEVLPLDETQGSVSENALAVPIEILGAVVGEIRVADEAKRQWTTAETQIIRATVTRVGQHLENLRLLAQAESYRAQAEQVSRRLTSAGWNEYLMTRHQLASGYIYDQNKVQPFNKNEHNTASLPVISHSLVVHDQTIGELTVNIDEKDGNHAMELVTAVAQQLSEHIENLRLVEQTSQSEARLRTLVENAPEAIAVIDLTTGFFTEPNQNLVDLYGLSREELLKVGPVQVSPPTQPNGRSSTEMALEKIAETMGGGAPVFEWMHRNAQGQDIPCEIRLVRLPGDRPQVRASVTNIAERKRNQEILLQRANQLETVAELSTTASTVLDPDRLLQAVVDLTKERFSLYHAHIYLANDAWQMLLLAAGAGEIGRTLVAENHSIPMNTEQSLVARAAREKKAVTVNDVRSEAGFLPNPLLPDTRSEIAVPMIVGDAVLGVFDVQSNHVDGFSKEDAAIYTTLAAQVAVALQNARLYVEQAATVTQLRELDRLKSSFLANMSHELRTPLNSILGFSDVMLEGLDGDLTPNMNIDLGLIRKNGQHLLNLINDVLDMAKIESGSMNLHLETFRIHEILDEVTSITSPLASEKNIALFIKDDSDQTLEVSADRTRMRQVMINLVNNSIKFTESGKISIQAQALEGDKVLITIKDTGIGIPPDKLEAIFQEFIQVDISTTRKVGGTGLGLPISRKLVEMHSGRLWAESTGISGEGSTFYVELPMKSEVTKAVQ